MSARYGMPAPQAPVLQDPVAPASAGRPLILMGRILAPHGTRGWIKVEPYGDSPAVLAERKQWWMSAPGGSAPDRPEGWSRLSIVECEIHDRRLAARPQGCEDRDAAAAYRGREVALQREDLPTLGRDEFYQVDLIGLAVVNGSGESLGQLEEMFSNGAHEVMRVVEKTASAQRVERLLPFIPSVVMKVDLPAGCIRVDWQRDW